MERSVQRSVLIVDDEPTIAEVVARYLERAGYHTRVALDGAAGARRPRPRSGPTSSCSTSCCRASTGCEVMRRLRDQAREPIGVILLTAKGEESDRVVGSAPRRRRLRGQAVLAGRARRHGSTRCCAGSTRPPRREARARARRASGSTRRRGRCSRAATRCMLTQREFDVLLVHGPPPAPGVLARAADGRGVAVLVLHRHARR